MKIQHERGKGNTTRAIVEVIHEAIVNDRSSYLLNPLPGVPLEVASTLIRDRLALFAPCQRVGSSVFMESIRTGQKIEIAVCRSLPEGADPKRAVVVDL